MRDDGLIARGGAPLEEAHRVMQICNACRYCEGICATFQAMSLRRAFDADDLDYLANLCHHCTACYHDCQYTAPHEFDVNVPVALADLRVDSYRRRAWPQALARAFDHNALVVTLATALSLVLVMLGVMATGVGLTDVHVGEGAFYAVVSHEAMITVAGVSFGFACLALLVPFVRLFATSRGLSWRDLTQAARDAATLHYLDGGHGEGCPDRDDGASQLRRAFHQATFWGFMACFAATLVATGYHYGLGIAAPYPFWSVPVLLGTLGGVGLLVGPAGLWWVKRRTVAEVQTRHGGLDEGLLVSLFWVSLTGLVLLALRETAAMGWLLVIHLGFVLGLFICLPYGKFVHGFHRLAALVRFAAEMRTGRPAGGSSELKRGGGE